MKFLNFLLTLVLLALLITGCGTNDTNDNPITDQTTPTTAAEATPSENTGVTSTPDAVTTASIVNTESAFETAISENGTWIIAILNDLTFDKELSLNGEFKNGKQDDNGNDVIQRKIALYSQDEDRNITARYTLTAPKLTINSPNASIQHGTFKGDLYVAVNDFQLVDATVDGNVYFSNDDVKSSFTMDDTSKITGTQEIKK